jgi:hypothetical protein
VTTFLEGVQRLRRESTMSGNTVATTVGATGDAQRLVDWYQSAYADIQNLHAQWDFLRAEFTGATVAAQSVYDPVTDWSLTEFGRWKRDSFRCFLTSVGRSGEMLMTDWDWQSFRDTYGWGVYLTNQGRPVSCSVRPDKKLQLYLVPNDVYTVTGEYFKKRDVLSGDSDTPIFPEQFHEVIMWRALTLYGGREAAGEQYDRGKEEYKRILAELERDQLPDMQWATGW